MALHYTPDSIERLLCSPGVFVELPAADASHARPEIPCRYFDLTATEDTGHDILPDGSLRGLLKAYEDGHNILMYEHNTLFMRHLISLRVALSIEAIQKHNSTLHEVCSNSYKDSALLSTD